MQKIEVQTMKEGYETIDKPVLTPCFMTRFEKARILGARAEELENGSALPMIETDSHCGLEIAELELKQGLLPMLIRRFLSDGVCEEIAVCNLVILD